jgi:uncharacterized repeat protein (TIGR03803 family)
MASLATVTLLAWGARDGAAASFRTLYAFAGRFGDAATPYAGLAINAAGRLFGTAYAGGASGNGAVFELVPPLPGHATWTETVLHSFAAATPDDGAKPTGRLVFGRDGELYGTTSTGGGRHASGAGTVFELLPPASPWDSWREITLHVFTGENGDGATPLAGLAIDAAGNLYGTTSAGGKGPGDGGAGMGTVFKLSPPAAPGGGWSETVLYRFGAADDGAAPQSDLLLAHGTLFGTTPSCAVLAACGGTIFAVTPRADGSISEATIMKFAAGGMAGRGPAGSLAMDAAGALYGTTSAGIGTAFRLAPPAGADTAWHHSVLARFTTGREGGPEGSVIIGNGGALYGTLTFGAHKSLGTIYKLTPPQKPGDAWPQTTLYAMPVWPRGGAAPVGELAADQTGTLYGVTEIGGAGGVGTVFRLTP